MPALGAVSQSSFVVPIVLFRAAERGRISFSTELILTNRGTTTATVALTYTAAFGGGSGTGVEALAPGEQKVIPDAIAYLIGRGIPIPASGDRGGTLQVGFYGMSSADAAAVTARTTTPTRAPHPVGAAGLAYPGTAEGSVVKTSATLFGIRATSGDRSNVAVYNPTASDVTIRVTAFAGDGSGASLTKAEGLTIPALGWTQFNGILDGPASRAAGSPSRERVARVRLDLRCREQQWHERRLVPPVHGGDIAGDRITVPVLVETTSGFLSEMIFANRGRSEATFEPQLPREPGSFAGDWRKRHVEAACRRAARLPDALEVLRGKGLRIGAKGAASYAGALRVRVTGAELSDVYAGGPYRVAQSGRGTVRSLHPRDLRGAGSNHRSLPLRFAPDANNRTNVAVVNAGGRVGCRHSRTARS
ncbi:MAG: hypothetical protein IPN03_20165 [Holophagales bacterium]|nr:hypothetical protein [Holophagales bacterium]